MLKIKLGQIESIVKSMEVITTKELPIQISYKFSKLMKQLQSEYEIFEATRISLVQRFAEKDAEGNIQSNNDGMVNLAKDTLLQFNDEFRKLCEMEIEFSFEPISIEKLGDINIPAKDLYNLDLFFKD